MIHRFTDREPTEPFRWIFFDVAGKASAYPTSMDTYHRFVALYGRPRGRWTAAAPDRGEVHELEPELLPYLDTAAE